PQQGEAIAPGDRSGWFRSSGAANAPAKTSGLYCSERLYKERGSMRSPSRTAFILSMSLAAGAAAMWSSGAAAQTHDHDAQHEAGEHHHADAAATQNPVTASTQSSASG